MLTPLRFRPVLKHYLWGGHQLREQYGKPVPADMTCAESWELVDRRSPADGQFLEQSVVACGPFEGQGLGELVDRYGAELLGRHAPQPRFPLLVKVLDAAQSLSVQVHPNDQQASLLPSPDLGKTEAWIVLRAAPGAKLYAGLKPGVDRAQLQRAIEQGDCEHCLHTIEPRIGDCIFISAGTVHALGEGLVIAEIQQSSDVTYRLYDWKRVGPDGMPRELHIEQGLEVVDFLAGPVQPAAPRPTDKPHVERLVQCDKFVIDRITLDEPQQLGGDNRAYILMPIEGTARVENDPAGDPLLPGETMLIPASLPAVRVVPDQHCVILSAYLP